MAHAGCCAAVADVLKDGVPCLDVIFLGERCVREEDGVWGGGGGEDAEGGVCCLGALEGCVRCEEVDLWGVELVEVGF